MEYTRRIWVKDEKGKRIKKKVTVHADTPKQANYLFQVERNKQNT